MELRDDEAVATEDRVALRDDESAETRGRVEWKYATPRKARKAPDMPWDSPHLSTGTPAGKKMFSSETTVTTTSSFQSLSDFRLNSPEVELTTGGTPEPSKTSPFRAPPSPGVRDRPCDAPLKTDIKATSHDPIKRMFQIFSAKLVLEVFGGGGAIWGFSEVCTLRNTDTEELWRLFAVVAAAAFAARWLMQVRDFMLEMGGRPKTDLSNGSMIRLVQIFSARFVLEVCGGGGAVWGFSETTGLRRAATQEFWRYNASVAAMIFFVRWCLQVREYMLEHGMAHDITPKKYGAIEQNPEMMTLTPKTLMLV